MIILFLNLILLSLAGSNNTLQPDDSESEQSTTTAKEIIVTNTPPLNKIIKLINQNLYDLNFVELIIFCKLRPEILLIVTEMRKELPLNTLLILFSIMCVNSICSNIYCMPPQTSNIPVSGSELHTLVSFSESAIKDINYL